MAFYRRVTESDLHDDNDPTAYASRPRTQVSPFSQAPNELQLSWERLQSSSRRELRREQRY